MPLRLSREEVIERAACLPAFPRVVTDILAALDDENATIGVLAQQVERDPVITARVLSLANGVAQVRYGSTVRDLATATSMIGLARLREVVVSLSLAKFAGDSRISPHFWEHSVAVGVSAQELARQVAVSTDYALVAGLLHDIGQLWMARFHPLEFQQVKMAMAAGNATIVEAERQYFTLDHCEIGLALADHWNLPPPVAAAIFFHHDADQGLDESLVAVTHVAEVLANALDLTGRDENQVSGLSAAACAALGIDWSGDMGPLFGRIEARAAYASAVFR